MPLPDDMTSMNISMPEALRAFVTERARGRFGSTSEYVRELIREDQRRALQERLEAKLLEGLDSGEPLPVTKDFWDGLRKRVADRASGKYRAGS